MDILTLFKAWEKMMDAMEELGADGVGLRSILCMTADYVAAKNGMTTPEMLAELMPFIESVNAEMGAMSL